MYQKTSYQRLHDIQNKEKRSLSRKERYQRKNKEINNVRRISSKKRYEELRTSVFKILGGFVCYQCGFDNPKALQIDHIHNTGHLDKKRFSRRDSFYLYYKTHPFEALDNLQILCANCNQIRINRI